MIINRTLPRISTTNGSQSGKKRKKASGSYRIYFRETAFLLKLHWLRVAVRESADAGIFFWQQKQMRALRTIALRNTIYKSILKSKLPGNGNQRGNAPLVVIV